MIMELLHRLHEKLADRFSFVQYPDIRPADQRTREASRSPGLHFKHAMPIEQRVGLVLVSLVMLVVGLAGAAFAGLVLYSVISVAFGQ
jgi:hypothetical protein